MHSAAKRGNHIECKSENVRVRQNADIILSLNVGEVVRDEIDVCAEIPHRKHYALREAGGAGSVHDSAHFVHIPVNIADILRFQSFRMCLGECCGTVVIYLVESVPGIQEFTAMHVDDTQNLRHLIEMHILVYLLLSEENTAV